MGVSMSARSVNIFLFLFCLSSVFSSNKTSSKKGIGVSGKRYMCGDVRAFSGISWYYNWGTHPNDQDHPECGGGESPAGFVPMIWGNSGNFPELQYDTILGFNEPNHQHQSNLDPEEAAYAWLELQAAYPGKTLVSPSASPPHTEEWFDAFFEVCDVIGCKVDYLATHSYTGNADHDINFINSLYQRYGRQVWFTEFAKPTTRDPDKELQYMKAILPQLEAAESVRKYSWFVTRFLNPSDKEEGQGGGNYTDWYIDKVVSLLEQDSPTLTTLGKFYDDF